MTVSTVQPAVSPPPPPVPFFRTDAILAGLDAHACLTRVCQSGSLVLGPEVRAFEAAFADYVGGAGCVGVGNGTDALVLALQAVGVGEGSRVLMAANAGFYASTAAYRLGACPVYVDVCPHTHLLTPEALAKGLAETSDVAAMVVTHLYGNVAAMPDIVALGRAHDVAVVEDCAQAHGAALPEGRAGGFGTLSCFSFYPTKNLGALGDGGAVCGRDSAALERVRKLRQYGWGDKYRVELVHGGNSRLDELQAAFLRDKLAGLEAANAKRRAIVARYRAALHDCPLQFVGETTPQVAAHLCVVTTPVRDALATTLRRDGIATAVHYPIPDHLQPAYDHPQGEGALPVTERLAAQVLSLPCYPDMPEGDVARVMQTVRGFFAGGGAGC